MDANRRFRWLPGGARPWGLRTFLMRRQISLKALLAFVALLSGWLAYTTHGARARHHAIEELSQSGVSVAFECAFGECGSHGFGRRDAPPSRPAWVLIRECFRAPWLAMALDIRMDDRGCRHLAALTSLRSLHLVNTSVTDAGLSLLMPLTSVEELCLNGTPITDAGLLHLKAFRRLRELDLAQTNVTDAGLVYLQCLPTLQKLDLRETRVTDAGLLHLKGFRRLR